MSAFRKASVFSLCVSFFALAVTPLASVYGASNDGIGGRPANPDPANPRTQSIFVYTLGKSEQAKDGIRVLNNSAETKKILVYAVDAVVSSGGSFACAQRADTKNEVGQWIDLAQNQVELAPKTSQVVNFNLTVPANAAVGEHNGCIVIEEAGQQSQAGENNGVSLSFRSALRVAVTVPGEIVKQLELKSLTVSYKENNKIVAKPIFKNTGNVSLDTNVEIKLKNLFGMTLQTQGGGFPVLAQNQAEFNFEFDKPFWGGFYTLRATGTFNADPQSGLGQSGNQQTVGSSPVTVFVAPQPLALVIQLAVLTCLVAGAGLLVRRQLRRKTVKEHWVEFTVEEGDTLPGLAKEHHVSWKKVAGINKIKPPYVLKAGSKIRLPNPQKSSKTVKKR